MTCAACGHEAEPTSGAYGHLAEPCKCTDAERLDAEVQQGAFMAPDAVDEMREKLEGAEALERRFETMGLKSAGYVMVPLPTFERWVSALSGEVAK